MDRLNITIALLYFSCFVNERCIRLFSLSSVVADRSDRMSFIAPR